MLALAEQVSDLRHLLQTDADPRVRHRAQAVLMLAQGASVLSVARWFRTAPHRVRVWRPWFREGGRDRLADDRRPGRPPQLGPADLSCRDEALPRGPQADGWPVTTWSIRDRQERRRRERHVEGSVSPGDRAVRGLGYRDNRPRHDVTHRQDAAAVASAQQALAWLGNERAPSPAPSPWSSSPSAKSIGLRTEGADGSVAAPRSGGQRLGRTPAASWTGHWPTSPGG